MFSAWLERICLHFLPKGKRTRNCKKSARSRKKLGRNSRFSALRQRDRVGRERIELEIEAELRSSGAGGEKGVGTGGFLLPDPRLYRKHTRAHERPTKIGHAGNAKTGIPFNIPLDAIELDRGVRVVGNCARQPERGASNVGCIPPVYRLVVGERSGGSPRRQYIIGWSARITSR